MMAASTTRGVLACAAALAALGLQTASAFLVVPPPSASSPASLELARRPFVGCVWLALLKSPWGQSMDTRRRIEGSAMQVDEAYIHTTFIPIQ